MKEEVSGEETDQKAKRKKRPRGLGKSPGGKAQGTVASGTRTHRTYDPGLGGGAIYSSLQGFNLRGARGLVHT